MTERIENSHSIPSYGYSFFVDNESGYDFTANLTFAPKWWNSAPGYNVEVLDPDGKLLFKEFFECLDFKDPTVFHGPSYGKPDASPPEPLKYPDHEKIYPYLEPVTIEIPVPATETGGVYQIRIVTPYASVNSEGRASTVELSLDPPLPFGWKGDMGFTDLCLNFDTSAKSGSAYFCSLPPGIIDDTRPNAGIKQWLSARGLQAGAAGFDVKIYRDELQGDDVLLKQITITPDISENGDKRRTWKIHETNDTPEGTLDYTITGPEYLLNNPNLKRNVYRIDWVNLDDGDESVSDHAHFLMLETHEATESRVSSTQDREQETNSVDDPAGPGDYKPPTNYLRQGATDVPLILCSDRNTAIRLNNGISYEYDNDLNVSDWDSTRITFLNSNQKSAWKYLKKARQSYKLEVVDNKKENTEDDPYWIGRPIDVAEGNVGPAWDYGADMQDSIREAIVEDKEKNTNAGIVDWESTNFWNENTINRLSNILVKPGLYEFLPCHIYEQNMDPESPWFGVFWNWHTNVHDDLLADHTNPSSGVDIKLGNPYSSVFRYLHDSEGNMYSNWQDKLFPRLGPAICNLGAPLAKMYSMGDTKSDFGLSFLREVNPFYKNVGIRNRLVLALLHQLMSFDQNGDSTYFNDDYRGGGISFATNTIMPLLDVWEDIGSTPEDIFTDEEAEEVKEIIKIGVMNHLERYAGYLQCSAHNQWVHAWIPMAKAAACFNDSAIDFLMLRNIKISDNRYNHNVPTWQESGGYDGIYCLFAIYSMANVRGYLLKRRDKIIESGGDENTLSIIELSLRDLESQIEDLTDYWNHTLVIEPDGSLNGSHDFNSRVDGSHWGTSPRRFLEFIGEPYGDTISIPEMNACQSLVAYASGRNYEGWNDIYRQWQHNVPDPYGVSFNLDQNDGDDASFEEKRAYVENKLSQSNDNPTSPTRFREPFGVRSDNHLTGLAGRGVNPSVRAVKPRPPGFTWMDKDDDTLEKAQGPVYSTFGIAPSSLSPGLPPQLPAHSTKSFVKIWPSFVQYNENRLYAYTNQNNVYESSSTRPDIGGISIKTSKYYCHIHTDGWSPANQKNDWFKRRNERHDPEYMWNMTSAAGGGFSLFTTPENGSIMCGRRKGWMGSNQIYMKRYKNDDDSNDPNLGEAWNQAIDEDGCGYAWAEPSSDNATVEWTPGRDDTGIIGTLTHKQHFNRNFLENPENLVYSHPTSASSPRDTFDQVSEAGGIGYIQREYVFKEDTVECEVTIVPKRTVNWDEMYMTIPISVMGRGYNSGDGQYVQNRQARKNKNRYNGDGNLPQQNTDYGDFFETEKNGCWKKEVFVRYRPSATKIMIGHRHFNELGTKIEFSGGPRIAGVVRLVSGPGTDPLYPQQNSNGPTQQDDNFFWPPTQEQLDKSPHLSRFGDGTVDALLEYCNGGKDQTDLPASWCVPAPSGYATKDASKGPGQTTDDALLVRLNNNMRNWINDVPVSFSFTMTPGQNIDEFIDEFNL